MQHVHVARRDGGLIVTVFARATTAERVRQLAVAWVGDAVRSLGLEAAIDADAEGGRATWTSGC